MKTRSVVGLGKFAPGIIDNTIHTWAFALLECYASNDEQVDPVANRGIWAGSVGHRSAI